MKALYRKWRSTRLAEVVGQEHITDALAESLRRGRVGHAYLFVGPRGTGKTSVARILAHEVNGFSYEIEDSYLDIIEIDAASNTGVDNIRELREKVLTAPAVGKYKVYIIDEVHMLSKSAFNALLKTLEEPPAHVIFIMATTDAHKVPVTIVSRSQKYVFRLASEEVMRAHLSKVVEAEGLKVDEGGVGVIARRSGGSFRDGLSLLEQVSLLSDGGVVTAGVVEGALGLPEGEKVYKLLECFTGGDVEGIVKILGELQGGGVRAEVVAEELIGRIVREPRGEYLGLLERLMGVGGGSFPEVRLLLALLGGGESAASLVSEAGTRARLSSQGAGAALRLEVGVGPTPLRQASETKDAALSPPMSSTLEGGGSSAEVAEVDSGAGLAREAVVSEALAASGSSGRLTAEGFTWEGLVEGVRGESAPLGAHLSKLYGEMEGGRLVIYAKTKFIKTIVDRGMRVIGEKLPEGVGVEVRAEMRPTRDARVAKISEIMGAVEEVAIDE